MDSKLREAVYTLESYNGIFRQLWELGGIKFTNSIERAAVAFNREGKCIDFLFNPEFYKEISAQQLSFIITHECLHVLLYHGKRLYNNLNYKLNPEIFNCAADIAIHEIMYKEFEFDELGLEHVTRENYFSEILNEIEECQTTDYYFEKIVSNSNLETKYIELDSHMFNEEDGDGYSDLINKAFNRLSEVEKKELKEKLKDITGRGDESVDELYNVEVNKVKKKKWEIIVKELSQAFIQADKFDWRRKNRRITSIDNGLFLPSYLELDIKKVNVWLFMDTSGSCIDLASRFFSAAASLPEKFFDPKLFCFDTKVYPTDIRKKEVFGGGGTSFDIIEEYIQNSNDPYPNFVFVITDGMGNDVIPEYPERWHIFLTSKYKDNFKGNCVFHSFDEFE